MAEQRTNAGRRGSGRSEFTVRRPRRPPRCRARRTVVALSTGGTGGNELLTVQIGAVLFVGLAVLGVTIVRIGQLTWLHLFLGLLLIGPVVLKMSSTGYRFARYYTGDAAYRAQGAAAARRCACSPRSSC